MASRMAGKFVLACVLVGVAFAQKTKPLYKVTTILNEPFMMAKSNLYDFKGNDRFYGFIKDLLEKLANVADFEFELQLVKDGRFGTLPANSTNRTWDGMVGEVQRGEVDFAAAPLTVTFEREKDVDFTKPYLNAGLVALLLKPTATAWEEVKNLFTLFMPFSVGVWLLTILAFFVISFALVGIDRLSPYEWRRAVDDGRASESEKNNFSLSNSLLFAFSTLAWQGYSKAPRSISGRILAVFWWAFVVIMIIAYTAGFTSLLLSGGTGKAQAEPPISEFSDLDGYRFNYGVVEGGSSQHFFELSRIPLYERMWKKMSADRTNLVPNVEEGVRKVQKSKGKYIMIMENPMVEYITSKNCDLMSTQRPITSSAYAFAVSPDPSKSVIKDKLNQGLLQLQQNGELSILFDIWFRQGSCNAKEDKGKDGPRKIKLSFDTLDMREVAAAFIILVIGLVISILTLVVELLIFKFWGEK